MKPADLDKFECVRTWLNAVGARGTGSEGTAMQYRYLFRSFLNRVNLDPDGLVKLAKEDPAKVKALLNEMIVSLEKEGKARKYTGNIFTAVMSFLRENDAQPRIAWPKSFVKTRRSRISADEIRTLMGFSGLRLRAIVAVAKDCGMSPVDILKLTYGDVRKGLEAGKAPIMIGKIRTKTKVDFETLLGPDAIEYLGYYLDARRKGTGKIPAEELSDRSPLFVTEDGKPANYECIKQDFECTRKRAGIAWTLYSLRSFFSTQLKSANVNDTIVEYWMGHTIPGEVDAYLYSPDNQERIYMDAYHRISLKGEQDLDGLRKQQLLDTAKLLKIDPEKLEKIRQLIEAREFGEDLIEEVGAILQSNGSNKGNKKESRYVTEDELPRFIDDGWEFVAQVNGKILIKRPG